MSTSSPWDRPWWRTRPSSSSVGSSWYQWGSQLLHNTWTVNIMVGKFVSMYLTRGQIGELFMPIYTAELCNKSYLVWINDKLKLNLKIVWADFNSKTIYILPWVGAFVWYPHHAFTQWATVLFPVLTDKVQDSLQPNIMLTYRQSVLQKARNAGIWNSS